MPLEIKSGPKAKKSLGQNFLQDKNIANRIVEELRIEPDDYVIEIGPGPGALTHIIHSHAPKWFTILEKDYYWAGAHRKEQPAEKPEVNVVLTDALLFPWSNLAAGKKWKVIGNLPYNVASPLMWDILSLAEGVERAVFMIQKEVGDRIVAQPGTKQYGALSVWLQSYCTPKRALIVPPTVFKPRPKVDSAVLSFVPLKEKRGEFDADALSRVLKVCFQQRRKQMQKILRGYVEGSVEAALESVGISPTARPENVTPRQFQELATTLKNGISS